MSRLWLEFVIRIVFRIIIQITCRCLISDKVIDYVVYLSLLVPLVSYSISCPERALLQFSFSGLLLKNLD